MLEDDRYQRQVDCLPKRSTIISGSALGGSPSCSATPRNKHNTEGHSLGQSAATPVAAIVHGIEDNRFLMF